MTTVKKSFFGQIRPQEGTGQYLPVGTHIGKVSQIAEAIPEHKDEVFTDHAAQLKLVVAVEGLGASATWLNDRGYPPYAGLTVADIPSDIDYNALGVSKTAFKALNSPAKIKAVFGKTKSGQAYRKDTMERLTDLNPESSDIDDQGARTKQAWEITGRAMSAMGLSEDQDIMDGQGSYVRCKVKMKENINGSEVPVLTILGPSDIEAYDKYVEAMKK